jgi:hypothetical protein
LIFKSFLQTRHLLLKRLIIFLFLGRADVATGGEDVALGVDLVSKILLTVLQPDV